jgi:hypothetical protein
MVVHPNISKADWMHLNLEERRALEVLLLIGRDPKQLIDIRTKLKIRRSKIETTKLLVGLTTVKRLVAWLTAHQIHLNAYGLQKLVRSKAIKEPKINAELAQFLAALLLDPTEPEHTYDRVKIQGQILNRRTHQLLERAEKLLDYSLQIAKGSYLTEQSKGAHPHLRGGALDIIAPHNVEEAVAALRQVGFAAWHRQRRESSHIHAVAIGDQELSEAAKWQIKSYFNGRDGRIRSHPDPHGGLPKQLPIWVLKYRLSA